MTALRLLLAVAFTVFVSVASAQTTTTSTTRYEKNRMVSTDADGSVTTVTRSRGDNGSDVYTTERTDAPRKLADILRDFPPSRALRRHERDGVWTGYQGSPRDVAWMESCRPSLVTDRYGMARYVYAKPGCETGDPQ